MCLPSTDVPADPTKSLEWFSRLDADPARAKRYNFDAQTFLREALLTPQSAFAKEQGAQAVRQAIALRGGAGFGFALGGQNFAAPMRPGVPYSQPPVTGIYP